MSVHSIEIQNHIFRECVTATNLWSQVPILDPSIAYDPVNNQYWIINHILIFRSEDGLSSTSLVDFTIALWSVWNHRNERMFRPSTNPLPLRQRML